MAPVAPLLEIVDPDAEVYAEITSRFGHHNRQFADWAATTFSVVHRTGAHIAAAARGVTNMGLVEIRGVWVDADLRGTGMGRAVMVELETEARRRGCTRAALDTYSWQAEGFYRRLGYRDYARLEYPNGTHRLYFVKDL